MGLLARRALFLLLLRSYYLAYLCCIIPITSPLLKPSNMYRIFYLSAIASLLAYDMDKQCHVVLNMFQYVLFSLSNLYNHYTTIIKISLCLDVCFLDIFCFFEVLYALFNFWFVILRFIISASPKVVYLVFRLKFFNGFQCDVCVRTSLRLILFLITTHYKTIICSMLFWCIILHILKDRKMKREWGFGGFKKRFKWWHGLVRRWRKVGGRAIWI